jgi:hypothetical protein
MPKSLCCNSNSQLEVKKINNNVLGMFGGISKVGGNHGIPSGGNSN